MSASRGILFHTTEFGLRTALKKRLSHGLGWLGAVQQRTTQQEQLSIITVSSPAQTPSGEVSFVRWGRTDTLAAVCRCPQQAAGQTEGTGI